MQPPDPAGSRITLNGRVPELAELAFLGQVNYGHFTSMQVRDRGVRGFSLHLKRLVDATRELFGSTLDVDRLRSQIRQIVSVDEAVSLRVTVFSLALDRAPLERPVTTDILLATTAAREPRTAPLRVRSVPHERVLPQIKHVGTFGLFHHWRQARQAGYDDALFVTAEGEISEGSIWNIGFWDGARVVWPRAPALPGITRQLLDAGLRASGIDTVVRPIHLDQLAGYRCAFTMNSGSVGPMIRSIDEHDFRIEEDVMRLLATAYAAQPLERI